MKSSTNGAAQGLEENLKKAVTEMLVLTLLNREDMYAAQLTQSMEEYSHGAVNIVFPYSALYRLISAGYILEAYKKTAPDGRRRQYYQITDNGVARLKDLWDQYVRFIGGVDLLLWGDEKRTWMKAPSATRKRSGNASSARKKTGTA